MRGAVYGLMGTLEQGTRKVRGQAPCSAGEDGSPFLGKLLAEGLMEKGCIAFQWSWFIVFSISLAL